METLRANTLVGYYIAFPYPQRTYKTVQPRLWPFWALHIGVIRVLAIRRCHAHSKMTSGRGGCHIRIYDVITSAGGEKMAGRKRKFPGKFRTPILPSHLLILYIHETSFADSVADWPYSVPHPLSLMIYLLSHTAKWCSIVLSCSSWLCTPYNRDRFGVKVNNLGEPDGSVVCFSAATALSELSETSRPHDTTSISRLCEIHAMLRFWTYPYTNPYVLGHVNMNRDF
jgi:hypothetical protein